MCVPSVDDLRKLIMEEAHCSAYAMHLGSAKMYRIIKENYWWFGMKKDIANFVSRCLVCQQVMAKHYKPLGTLHPLPIPEWKWKNITMHFVIGLPCTQTGYDAIWVIMDRLTKSAHFLAIRNNFSLDKLAKLYISEILKLYGVLVSIVSIRDPQFTSWFWPKLQTAFGTTLDFSIAFHPQTDGQSERTIQTLEDMLWACVLEFKDSWVKHFRLVEFTYNNSYQASIGMASYDALYGRKCRTPICWDKISERKLNDVELIEVISERFGLFEKGLRQLKINERVIQTPR